MFRLIDNTDRVWRVIILIMIALSLTLFIAGYLPFFPDEDVFFRIWGVIGTLTVFVIILAIRIELRAKVFGPDESVEGTSLLLKVMKNAREFLFIIDAYPGEQTIRVIAGAPESIEIRLLTTNLDFRKDAIRAFEAMAAVFREERSSFEVRYAPKGLLHDRFILTKPAGYHLGQSIKDFGKKHSRISELSVKETEDEVDRFWKFWEQSESLF